MSETFVIPFDRVILRAVVPWYRPEKDWLSNGWQTHWQRRILIWDRNFSPWNITWWPVNRQRTTKTFMLWILWAKHIKTETPWPPFCGQYFQIILLSYQMCRILIQISLKFVHRSLINNEPALVQTMDCRQSGEKPFTDAYMRPSVSVVLSIA